MTKHFLLINEHGSDNIGDHAINEGLKELLDEKGITHTSTSFLIRKTARPKKNNTQKKKISLSFISKIIFSFKPLFHLWWFIKNRSAIKKILDDDYDGVIIGGGQLILSGFAFPIAMYSWIKHAKNRNLPVFVVGVGCGENFLFSETLLYKNALKKCEKIFVREQASVIKMHSFFSLNVGFSPDLAFALYPIKTQKTVSGIIVGMTDFDVYKRYKKEMQSTDFPDYDSYLTDWSDRLIKLLINKDEIIYLVSTTFKDAECNQDLYKQLLNRVSNPIKLIDGVMPLDEYRLLLSQARLVFSGRMHSLILGLVENCYIEPWVISCKISGFLNTYENYTVQNLQEKLSKDLELFNIL